MPHYKNVLTEVRFSLEKMQKVSLFETNNFFCDVYYLEPGQIQKTHRHEDADEIYFVLEGEGLIQIGDEDKLVKANEICLANPA